MTEEHWYERNPERLEKEKAIMADRFPEASLKEFEDGGLGWVLSFLSEQENEYTVLVKYPEEYPEKPPNGFVLEPSIEPEETRHMRSDGSLSLQQTREWNQNSTTATALACVVAWCNAYDNWAETGEWPGIDESV